MQTTRLHDIPYQLVPREVPPLLCFTPAGFPSPAQDDMEEPIDLGAWLVDHPAASYVMRVEGRSTACVRGITSMLATGPSRHVSAPGAAVEPRLSPDLSQSLRANACFRRCYRPLA
jgi:hypothetical protein